MKLDRKKIITTLKRLSHKQGLTMLAELSAAHTPFQMLIATILSARAKDEVTLPVSKKLFEIYPAAKDLAYADPEIVKSIIKKIGFYNTKTRAVIATAKKIHEDLNDKVPETMEGLLKLQGVGRKVANCILVYAFGQDAIPVDTHVHRISNRLGWVKTKAPEETEKALEALVPKKYWPWINETFVSYGKTVCAPISPFCSRCPISKTCPKVGVTTRR